MTTRKNESINLSAEDFKQIGHQLVDSLSSFLEEMPKGKVTLGESPKQLEELLSNQSFAEHGTSSTDLIQKVAEMLTEHSLFNGHPKFMGYITSSPAPLGILADFLASAVNQNVGAQILSPLATEIEKQTISWLCDFIGVSNKYGGVLVSGGNMANFTAFLAARNTIASNQFKTKGLRGSNEELVFYCPKSTHTWIDKASVLFGHGSESVRWINTDEANKMRLDELRNAILKDKELGFKPAIVIGTAGDVSTGVIDDLEGISKICKEFDCWFHVDGAYGAPAALLPELSSDFQGLEKADSIAIDPHKWLYAPLEVGCTLVKNPEHLVSTFSSHPDYYNFDHDVDGKETNFFEYGLQNSRGFRALKVWMVLQQVGRKGYQELIREDIALSMYFYQLADANSELEAFSQNLSIATFRFVPKGFNHKAEASQELLNELNEKLVNTLQLDGNVFLSNAVIRGSYCMRACIVNFKTSKKDIEESVELITKRGNELFKQVR